jgi:hypothetical protein
VPGLLHVSAGALVAGGALPFRVAGQVRARLCGTFLFFAFRLDEIHFVVRLGRRRAAATRRTAQA